MIRGLCSLLPILHALLRSHRNLPSSPCGSPGCSLFSGRLGRERRLQNSPREQLAAVPRDEIRQVPVQKSPGKTTGGRCEQDGLGGQHVPLRPPHPNERGEQGSSQIEPKASVSPLNQDGTASGGVDGILNRESRGPVKAACLPGDHAGSNGRAGRHQKEQCERASVPPGGRWCPSVQTRARGSGSGSCPPDNCHGRSNHTHHGDLQTPRSQGTEAGAPWAAEAELGPGTGPGTRGRRQRPIGFFSKPA